MAKKTPQEPDFETALQELETLVEKMEQGELSLEESLSHFERGVKLSSTCQQARSSSRQGPAATRTKAARPIAW